MMQYWLKALWGFIKKGKKSTTYSKDKSEQYLQTFEKNVYLIVEVDITSQISDIYVHGYIAHEQSIFDRFRFRQMIKISVPYRKIKF